MKTDKTFENVKKELRRYASTKRKETNEWFFKTGKGEYGEGDVFIGVSVPDTRKVAKQFLDLPLRDLKKLFSSKIHEERLTAHHILTYRFEKGSEKERETIYTFYLKNSKHVNNWDLVDTSAHKIVGAYLLSKSKSEQKILNKLARSENMWERRIAIVSTWMFIRKGEIGKTFELAKILLKDKEDLLHKAVGWMLREAGKKSQKDLEGFLKKYYKEMPRTMLRYAIEKFREDKRQKYLKGKV